MWIWIRVCKPPQPPTLQNETGIQIPVPDSTGRLSDPIPVQSRNPDTADHRPCPNHRGKYRNHTESPLGSDQCRRLAKVMANHRDKLRRLDSHPRNPNSDPGAAIHQMERKDKPVRTTISPESSASPARPRGDCWHDLYTFPSHPDAYTYPNRHQDQP